MGICILKGENPSLHGQDLWGRVALQFGGKLEKGAL